MGACELCGKEGELVAALIEGTEVNVCYPCGKFGKILRKPVQAIKEKLRISSPKKPEIIQMVMGDYSDKIRKARGKLNLTQKEFAKKLNEKESIIQKIETGSFKPSLGMARKLEKALRVKLIEEVEEKISLMEQKESKELTIGDVIKIKR